MKVNRHRLGRTLAVGIAEEDAEIGLISTVLESLLEKAHEGNGTVDWTTLRIEPAKGTRSAHLSGETAIDMTGLDISVEVVRIS